MPIEEQAGAFAKGGCGCLIAFAVIALFFVLIGGSAHIDVGGAICLFVGGGLIGLLVLWVYNKGKQDAGNPPVDQFNDDDRVG